MRLHAIEYCTRDLGYGSDEGVVHGYLTDEVDTWGKRTILVVWEDGSTEKWYLFPDEYTARVVEPA